MVNYHRPQETCQESFILLKDLKAPIFSKLTVLSALTPSLPNCILIAAFIWSQVQLFFLVSRSAALSLLDSKYNFATQVLDLIDDNFFFGNIFDFANYPKLTILLLVITFIYLLLAALAFAYILLALKNQAPFFPYIQKTLKILIDLHPRILFYPIHINAVKLISRSIDQGQDESFKLTARTFSLIVLVLNVSFTVVLTTWFATNTKTKHPFTSKTSLINSLDLAVKLLVPFLWYKGSLSDSWRIILMIAIILFCRYRDWILFKYLPYYRVYAMKIATISHALLSSYVWSLGFGWVFHLAHKDWSQYNVTMLFLVIFGPIFLKLYTAYCHRIRVKILLKPKTVKNTFHFLHYYDICKSFASFKSTGMTQRRIDMEYMDFMNSLVQSETAGHLLKEVNQDWNSTKQKTVNKYFLKKSMEIIQASSEKNSQLAKLTLARFYGKHEANYAQASHIIDGELDSNIFQRNSYLYIKVKILQKLQAKCIGSQNKEQLHVGEFIILQETFKKIQKDFIKSIGLHSEFWKHFQLPKPDLLQLLDLAQKSKYRSRKLKYVTQASRLFAQHNFPEPLLVCGLYLHFFQYEMATAQSLIQEFFQLEQKNKEKQDHHGGFETINTQHRFTSEAIYFVVSPAQNKLGQILDCSGRVGSVLGIPKDLLVRQSLNALIPPSFVKYHDNFLKTQQQNTNHSVINKTREVTTLMKDGYIASAHLHIAFTHVRNFELCYYALLEPIKDDIRILTIANNGLMSSCSRNFAEDLGIIDYGDRDSVNIREICPDFGNEISSAKRKFGSVLKSIQNMKRTSLGHAHLQNVSSALGNAKISLSLSEGTHVDGVNGEQKQKQEQEQEAGYHVRTISTKEAQLSFFPCWYRTPQEREGVEPLVYQAQIRKFEVAGVEMVELKMKKLSNFSFVPPLSTLRQGDLKAPRAGYLSPAAKVNSLDVPTQMSTMRTENGPLLSPKNSTCSSAVMISPKFSPKNPLFSKVNFSPLLNYETSETPQLIEELVLEEDKTSPELKKVFSGRPKGDDDDGGLEMSDSERSESPKENKKTEEKIEGLLNVNFGEVDSIDEGAGSLLESAKSVRNQKLLKSILESKTRRKETIAYIFFFLVTSGVLLFLLIWLNFYTTTTSKKVAQYSEVLQSAYFRSYWTILATQNILYWAGCALEWVYYPAGLGVLVDAFANSFNKMNSYNRKLEISISGVNAEILELAYTKNVRIFDRDVNNELQFVAYDETFSATERIITKGMASVLAPQVFVTELNQDIMFILDNSVNDLQVSSQSIITLIKDNLFAIFGDSRNTMMKAIGGVFGVVLLFMAFSLKYIITANAEFKRFANVLFTLETSEIKEIEHFAMTFKEILEKDTEAKELLGNLFDVKKNQHNNDRNVKRQNLRKTYDHTKADASVKKIHARNYALFVGLLVFTGFTIAFTSAYYSKASRQLTVMENQHSNINSALSYVNNVAWITIELQLISLLNSTVETRNLPINETILNDIEALRDVVTLKNSLKNQDGGFSPAMEAILFDFLCDNAYTPYYSYGHYILRRNCLQTADGGTSVGLLELTARIGVTLTTAIPEFLKGPKDLAALQDLYYKAFYTYGQPCDVEFMLLLNAYSVAESEFDGLVADLSDLQVTLAWIAVTISLVLGVLVWIFAIKKLTRMELEIKELILLVPSRVIMKNMLLKRYIVLMARSESQKNQGLKLLR